MSKVNVSFDIELSRIPELEAFLNGEKPKAGRPKKGEDPVFDTEDETAAADDDFNFGGEEDPAGIDKKTLLNAVKERVTAKKQTALGKLFSAYKIKNLDSLKEDKYEAFYKDLQKIKV